MQTDGVPDNPRCNEYGFEILHAKEDHRDEKRMRPVAPLCRRNQDRRHPANHDANVGNHGEENDEQPDQRRKVKTQEEESRADQNAIDQADEKLPAEIGDDVAVDLRQDGGDFIFQRRIAERQIFFPAMLNGRSLLEQKEKVNRNHHETKEEAGDPEEVADACLKQRPELVDESGDLTLQIR